MPLAWVPYADRAEAERRLGAIPAGLELDFYRADGDGLPATIGEVAYYVLPYMKGTAVLDRVADAPAGGRADAHGRLRGRAPAAAGRGDAVQRGRAARHQHGRAGGGARPGQRTASGLVRQEPGLGPLGPPARPVAGRPAGADRGLRAHRRRPSRPACRASRSPRSPGCRAAAGPGRRPFTRSRTCPRCCPRRTSCSSPPRTRRRPRACSAPASSASCRTARCWSTWPAASSWTRRPCWRSCRPGGSRPRWT